MTKTTNGITEELLRDMESRAKALAHYGARRPDMEGVEIEAFEAALREDNRDATAALRRVRNLREEWNISDSHEAARACRQLTLALEGQP